MDPNYESINRLVNYVFHSYVVLAIKRHACETCAIVYYAVLNEWFHHIYTPICLDFSINEYIYIYIYIYNSYDEYVSKK